ncbi:MAG: hypothetical protein OEV30_11120 [Ignavibacteria bacterium]|nr:hypothetical protein [Ignavibacteria bacterium]
MRFLRNILLALLAGIVGCAELRENLPTPVLSGPQVHPDGWLDTESTSFHGEAVRALQWDMTTCRSCHGGLYDGGTVDVSCRTCHDQSAGPEHCTTCHGESNPAPPRGLYDEESNMQVAVGAHQVHFRGANCSWCHNVPAGVYVPGHVDSPPPAEVVISGWLSRADTSVSTSPPSYDYQDNRCSNSFCHGNWTVRVDESAFPGLFTDSVMVGSNYSPLWTGGSDEIACGTCHGLPPTGHLTYQLSECGACHDMIVGANGEILDGTKHINGRINVFGIERDF